MYCKLRTCAAPADYSNILSSACNRILQAKTLAAMELDSMQQKSDGPALKRIFDAEKQCLCKDSLENMRLHALHTRKSAVI